jgi:hypothetical protein
VHNFQNKKKKNNTFQGVVSPTGIPFISTTFFYNMVFGRNRIRWTDILRAHAVKSALQFEQKCLLFRQLPTFTILGSWTHAHVVFVTFRTGFVTTVSTNINSLSVQSQSFSYGERM